MEFGIVTFFNNAEGKKFGFLSVLDEDGNPTKEEVFFHYNDGEFARAWDDEATFSGAIWMSGGMAFRLNLPQKGDRLVFRRAPGGWNKPEKASPWGYAEHYEAAIKELAERPVYRVIRWVHYNAAPGERLIEWEGQNLNELSIKYPKGMLGKDPLANGSAEGGHMSWSYHFERQHEDGAWWSVDDPREFVTQIPADIFLKYTKHGVRQSDYA